MQKIQSEYCRFPKLEECAHFHYERVQLGTVNVKLIEDKSDIQSSSNASQHENSGGGGSGSANQTQQSSNTCWFIIRVTAEKSEPFLIRRSLENLQLLDEMLHRCVYDRKISGLMDLNELELSANDDLQLENIVADYLTRFSAIASDSVTCGPILTWFQLDNKGHRLPLAEPDTMKSINTPAVGAAYGIRKYNAQAVDEISIEVGDMISVIDMPSPAESTWWRGKKSHLQKSQYEVGFFPQSCVATIGDKVPRNLVLPAPLVGSLDVSPTKPVLRKHGKLIAFFRSFILSRPSRRRLKQSGIYKERVFSCDLSEHLLNSGQEIPMVLKSCAEFIEANGIVDGIYRLSGITSNIQKLRRGFDEERIPDLAHPEIKQDIHAMSSLLKMYFRELPNPLCTYQLYEHFVEAIQNRGDASERLAAMKETVQKLPPPHYRTLKYLATHLNKIAQHSARTGMTDRNLAIVWAPNLLRSPALEAGGVAALRGVGVQAVVTEYLITNCHLIFDADDDFDGYEMTGCDSFTDAESVEHREHDQTAASAASMAMERPKSLSVGGARLISLEEAQNRQNRIEFIDVNKSNPINTPGGSSSYIEVGGGPSSLPDKYHTVLPVPRSWQKRKTHSWKSLFTRGQRNSNNASDLKGLAPITSASTKASVRESNASTKSDEKVTHVSLRNGQKNKMNKSVEIYEVKPMEICVRSSSADSLRTAGHSRSVSHDSYFDLLQSPLRGGTATATSPSREYSELGLNFDREEPEMRIFSESESLVSSPRVPKDMQARRVTRCRTDDYTSATNSVNPSPKKQPRLNIPSPSIEAVHWATNVRNQLSADDESTRKRSKVDGQYNLEDPQALPDIQFIDCITPEHSITVTNTIYACAQVHNAPSSKRSSIFEEDCVEQRNQLKAVSTKDRHSNPENSKNKNGGKDGRYSYPGIGEKFAAEAEKKYVCRFPINSNANASAATTNGDHDKDARHNFCDSKSSSRNTIHLSLNGCVNDGDPIKRNESEYSKLSIPTPSSPSKSPHYSLLVGDTSSENSSSLNTPIYDMEMSSTIGQFDQRMEGISRRHAETKEMSSALLSEDGNVDDVSATSQLLSRSTEAPVDMAVLKRDLSLDLEKSKMSVDDVSLSSKQNINISSASNTPNFTTSGSTSQSMTPSEFGYHRQSNVVSTDNSPKSDMYESIEQAFKNYEHCTSATAPLLSVASAAASTKGKSPIKSTINITYKSPTRTPTKSSTAQDTFLFPSDSEMSRDSSQFSDYEPINVATADEKSANSLLETSFDETMVYEQLKFFKGAVSEVNHLLDNGNEEQTEQTTTTKSQVVPNICEMRKKKPEANDCEHTEESVALIVTATTPTPETINDDKSDSDDVLMPEQELQDTQDSLEFDQNVSMYENVNLRKPRCVYANVDLRHETKTKSHDAGDVGGHGKENNKPGNFIVRQLANKFETSPVDSMPPFDFSKPFNRKSCDTNRNAPPLPIKLSSPAKVPQPQQFDRSCAFTRSLDENAFVREFGGSTRVREKVHKSTQQIPLAANVLTENSPSRRLSMECTRPKSLNPPKRLPLTLDDRDELCKVDERTPIEVKITPTTENPISLIQHNVNIVVDAKNAHTVDDERNNAANKVQIGNFKLDRERIERIKEERRHQLNEKFRSESFKCEKDGNKVKSKSKIELTDLKEPDKRISDTLQYKSKSRNEIYNKRDADVSIGLAGEQQHRVRRISDEKNQNDCIDSTITSSADEQNVAFKTRKFDRRSIDLKREQDHFITAATLPSRAILHPQRDQMSPQISIRDVAAMFESRSQNQ